MEIVRLSMDSYEEVRRNARLFFSAQDHQAIAVESGAGIVSAAETGMSWSRRLALPGRSPTRITCCETARRNHPYPVRSQTPVFGWYTKDGRCPRGLDALASRRAWVQPTRW